MVREAEIQEFVDKVVEEFAPQRVILFGSHARGDATSDSDVDLLVIMPTKMQALDQAVEIRQRIDHHFALDLLVRTPAEVNERLALGDFFPKELVSEGKTLYKSARRGVCRGRRQMKAKKSFADYKEDGHLWITLATGEYYPDILPLACELYKPVLVLFGQMLERAHSSTDLFMAISPSRNSG